MSGTLLKRFSKYDSTSVGTASMTTQADFNTWEYRYSPQGREQKRMLYSPLGDSSTDSHPNIYYQLGASGEMLAVFHGRQTAKDTINSNVRRVYWYENQYLTNGGAVSIMSDSVRKYKITDYAGSTRAEIIYNSKLGITTGISTFDYKPYGDTLDACTNFLPVQTFAGEEKDVESSYMDMGYRTYDPLIGRFLQVDPLNESFPNITPFCYSYNSPMTWSDPSGLYPRFFETASVFLKMAIVEASHRVSEVEAIQNIYRDEHRITGNPETLSTEETLKRLRNAVTGFDEELNAFGESVRGSEFRQFFDYCDELEIQRDAYIRRGRELMNGKTGGQIFDIIFAYNPESHKEAINTMKMNINAILQTEAGNDQVALILGYLDKSNSKIDLSIINPDEREKVYPGQGNGWLGMTEPVGNTFKLTIVDDFTKGIGEVIGGKYKNFPDPPARRDTPYESYLQPNSLLYNIAHEFGHMEMKILYGTSRNYYKDKYWMGDSDNQPMKEVYADMIAYRIYQQFLKKVKK